VAAAEDDLSTMSDRLPPIPPENWTDAQQRFAREIIEGPRGALISPFIPLLRSPELMSHAQRMGEYLRYRSALGLRLSELAILIVARHWSQDVEWAIHEPIARREGISAETVEAISLRRKPLNLPEDEAVVYEFCLQLNESKKVEDCTWNQAVHMFGEQGAVDLVGINGYYTLLAMVMNAAQTPPPPTSVAPLPAVPEIPT
jgi:4-carboxymuconolactone decarboxylase